MIAGVEEGEEHRVDRGHPGGESRSIVSVLEDCNLFLPCAHGRVARARVGVTGRHVVVDRRLNKCGRLVDRGQDAAGGRIRCHSCVDLLGAKTHALGFVVAANLPGVRSAGEERGQYPIDAKQEEATDDDAHSRRQHAHGELHPPPFRRSGEPEGRCHGDC